MAAATLLSANLAGVRLNVYARGVDLRDACLRGSRLDGVDLSGAWLGGSTCPGPQALAANLALPYLVSRDLFPFMVSSARHGPLNCDDARRTVKLYRSSDTR